MMKDLGKRPLPALSFSNSHRAAAFSADRSGRYSVEPMKPMEPMEPMKPLDFGPPWWPKELGQPASSGGQNDIHYAFFPEARRLAIRRGNSVTLHDSGDHRISGVQSQGGSMRFTSQSGEVRVEDLPQVR